MAMTVEIKGNKLCIEIDLEKPTPSSSGKTLVVASTRGTWSPRRKWTASPSLLA